MRTITRLARVGYGIQIWPHYRGYTVVLLSNGLRYEARSHSVKKAALAAEAKCLAAKN